MTSEPFVARRCPLLRVRSRRQILKSERLARTGLIDAEGRDASASQCLRQSRPIKQFLAAIESVHVEHARHAPLHVFPANQQTRKRYAFIRDLDALAVLAAQRHRVAKSVLRFRERLVTIGMAMTLHTL